MGVIVAERNPYDVLGVKRGASEDELKAAYRRRAKALHPDLHPNDPSAENKFKELGKAFEDAKALTGLTGKIFKRTFDAAASVYGHPKRTYDPKTTSDIFHEIFKEGEAGKRRQAYEDILKVVLGLKENEKREISGLCTQASIIDLKHTIGGSSLAVHNAELITQIAVHHCHSDSAVTLFLSLLLEKPGAFSDISFNILLNGMKGLTPSDTSTRTRRAKLISRLVEKRPDFTRKYEQEMRAIAEACKNEEAGSILDKILNPPAPIASARKWRINLFAPLFGHPKT